MRDPALRGSPVICKPCRLANEVIPLAHPEPPMAELSDRSRAEALHRECPEAARREAGLSPVELAGSAWCDCQHVLPADGRLSAAA